MSAGIFIRRVFTPVSHSRPPTGILSAKSVGSCGASTLLITGLATAGAPICIGTHLPSWKTHSMRPGASTTSTAFFSGPSPRSTATSASPGPTTGTSTMGASTSTKSTSSSFICSSNSAPTSGSANDFSNSSKSSSFSDFASSTSGSANDWSTFSQSAGSLSVPVSVCPARGRSFNAARMSSTPPGS